MKLIYLGLSIVLLWMGLVAIMDVAFGQELPAPGSVDYQVYATLIRQQRDAEAQAKSDALADNSVMRKQIADDQAKAVVLRQYWADYVAGLKVPGADVAKP